KGPFAQADADLQKIAGFGTDGAANKAKAKQLLADAGQTNLTFKFLNRNITTPYEPVALFVIDQWKQVGITATHDVKETSAYQADLRAGNSRWRSTSTATSSTSPTSSSPSSGRRRGSARASTSRITTTPISTR